MKGLSIAHNGLLANREPGRNAIFVTSTAAAESDAVSMKSYYEIQRNTEREIQGEKC
jgi:hypothetical protein